MIYQAQVKIRAICVSDACEYNASLYGQASRARGMLYSVLMQARVLRLKKSLLKFLGGGIIHV